MVGRAGVPTKDDGHGRGDDAAGAQSSTREGDAGEGAKPRLGEKELHIAPMIDVSTIEFRYFIRLLTKRAVIWNQMVVAETLYYRSGQHLRDRARGSSSSEEPQAHDESDFELTEELSRYCGWFDFNDGVDPRPTICQIGTNNHREAYFASRVARECGYDEVNLNAECPSDRVKGKCFGAALMKDQDTAVSVVRSMVMSSKEFPVSVKTRTGVDECDSFEYMSAFIQRLVEGGCRHFTLHARKVLMQGLSPAANRTVPPLSYDFAYRLMRAFPNCTFILNGGMRSLDHCRGVAYGSHISFDSEGRGRVDEATSGDDINKIPYDKLPPGSHLEPEPLPPANLKGVMVGRLARDRPSVLWDVDRYFYGEEKNPCRNRREVMEKYMQFIDRVYPRRCCDNDENLSLGIGRDKPVKHVRDSCDLCSDFRSCAFMSGCKPCLAEDGDNAGPAETLGSRRAKRHKNHANGTKVVSRIIDKTLQPVHGILYGKRGNKPFLRESSRLSRDLKVRNCGAAFILWSAMKKAPSEVWDEPFEYSESCLTDYFPTK